MKKNFFLPSLLVLLDIQTQAQDSLSSLPSNAILLRRLHQATTPAILLGLGSLTATTPPFHSLEKSWQQSLVKNGVKHTHLDDYLQYSPAMAYYALDVFGVKSKHNLKNKLFIHIVSEAFATGLVTPMKHIIHRQRPDGSDFKSFPSGHTTTAFVGAELLHQEYGHISPWISIAGYTTAAATGYLRMQNNAHWLGDVIAGAGMGILSARLGYWVVKKYKKRVTRNKLPV